MGRTMLVIGSLSLAILVNAPAVVGQSEGSLPLDKPRDSGAGVSPVFEGWYRNDDGTYTLSFGYINRNRKEVVEIPVGAQNFIEPAQYNHQQPTHFEPFRHYGWFTVRVPSDFGTKEVVWTLEHRGERYSIPGWLQVEYEIDAMRAAGSGDTPPFLRVGNSAEARGPLGVKVGPMGARVGEPLQLDVWARDEHNAVTLRWYEYQGPGSVTFAKQELAVAKEGGSATTTATFSEPGNYVLYVRANNAPLGSAGLEQCCWTNGYVQVTVTR